MKRVLLVIIVLIGFQDINAQYTEIINSKRPGFSESPYSVGTKVYQFETGLFYKHNNNESILANPSTFGGELFFRTSHFLEKLEINLNMAYQNDEIKNPFGDNYNINGLSDLRFGVKYLIYQQEYTDKSKEIRSWKARTSFDKKRLIPSVGVYGGINTNFLSEDYKAEGISFKGAALLQNDFSDRLVLITNLIVDDIASESMEYSYIVTMTYALNQNWSFFVENVGKYETSFAPEYQLGTGIAYLISPNLQVDASIRTNLFDSYSEIFAATGLSWRLDRHQDALMESQTSQSTTKKGFFSRIFGKN